MIWENLVNNEMQGVVAKGCKNRAWIKWGIGWFWVGRGDFCRFSRRSISSTPPNKVKDQLLRAIQPYPYHPISMRSLFQCGPMTLVLFVQIRTLNWEWWGDPEKRTGPTLSKKICDEIFSYNDPPSLNVPLFRTRLLVSGLSLFSVVFGAQFIGLLDQMLTIL